jgi:signal peptidase II
LKKKKRGAVEASHFADWKQTSWILVLLLLADVLSKILVESFLKPLGSIAVLGNFFHISYVQNTGAAFGQFHGQVHVLAWVSLLCLGVLFFLIQRTNQSLEYWGYWLIFSGALGNLIDRVFRGYVVDFLDFDIWDLHIPASWFFHSFDLERWYIFNFADAYICIGTGLVLWAFLGSEKK